MSIASPPEEPRDAKELAEVLGAVHVAAALVLGEFTTQRALDPCHDLTLAAPRLHAIVTTPQGTRENY